MQQIETTESNLLLQLRDKDRVILIEVADSHQAIIEINRWMESADRIVRRDIYSDKHDPSVEFELYTLPDMKVWHPEDDERHTIFNYVDD